jgi:xanthine dehydrogenase YagT iron-sulfur-binding subunit
MTKPPNETGPAAAALTRRAFLKNSIAMAGATTLDAAAAPARTAAPSPAPAAVAAEGPSEIPVALRVNGQSFRLTLDTRTTVLDALREHLGLTGAKKGCNHGQCGACTVLIDGQRVVSCLSLAVQAQGKDITTIEGLATDPERLHPLQQAFIDRDALQCGYCTPGQILSGIACIREGHARSDDEVREYMSGNLCRCGAYHGIVAAIRDVAGREA